MFSYRRFTTICFCDSGEDLFSNFMRNNWPQDPITFFEVDKDKLAIKLPDNFLINWKLTF